MPLDVDIRDMSAVHSGFGMAGKIDWVIHTAAKTDTGACERDPALAYAVNGEGTGNIVAEARALSARLIYISTVSVFSGGKGDYREIDVPQPINVHNKSKVMGEEKVAAYDKGMTLRLNLIGIHPEGSRGKNFLEWLVDSFHVNKDMKLFDDVFINPLSNWTIAECIRLIIEKEIEEPVLHIGSSNVLSKAAIGELVAKHFPKFSGKLTHSSVDLIADGVVRPKQMWLNTNLAQKRLGISMPTVEAELEIIFKHSAKT